MTVTADEQQLTEDESALTAARAQLKTDEAAGCPTVTATPNSSSTGSSSTGSSSSGGSSSTATASKPSSGSTASTTATTVPATSSTTTTSVNSCTQDNNTITSDKQTDERQQLSVEQAQASLASTKATIATNATPSPAAISQDEAQVAQDTQTVSDDQKALSETTLTSPVAGTVTAVNDSVGESVSGSSSASSSGGSTSSAASGGGAGGAGAATSTSSSSSSSGVITITNLGQLEVVAGFAEADITNIKVGQPATATLAALPNTELSGTVTAVSPTSTVSSNVVTYDVTISLDDPPSTVKPGMTANVSVITASKSDVLELPSAAITTTGTNSTVTTLVNGTQSVHPVVVGLVGSSTTQILSGVSDGEVVVEPTVSVAAGASTTTGAGAAGGLGGGAGGLGGGGGLGGAARG